MTLGKCTGYQIRYCTNKQFKKCKTKRIKGRKKLSCTLKGLKAGKTYYYQIRCYRKVGKKTYCSDWSKCKKFKTKKSKAAKAKNKTKTTSKNKKSASTSSEKSKAKKNTPKKTGVSSCSPKKNSCIMKWKKCSGKCTGYQIRYCTNKSFKGCRTKRIKGRSNCSCTLKGLKAGTTYYCQIRCYRKVGKKMYYSAWSNAKICMTPKKKVESISSGTSGFRTIRGAKWTTTGGGSPAFSKTVKAAPQERKIGKYYYGNRSGLYYRNSNSGTKNYITQSDYVSGGITDGNTAFYGVTKYDNNHNNEYETVYKYDISTGNTALIVRYYTGDIRRLELVACYGNYLYFNRSIDRWYEGCGDTVDVLRYDMNTGETEVIKYNCYLGEQCGEYVTASTHDFAFGLNMNKIYNLKTGEFKTICKKGCAVLTPKNIYYVTWGVSWGEEEKLYKCSYSAKNKKKITSLKGGGCLWMSDSKIGYMTDTKAYTVSYKTGKKKRL